MKHQKPSRLRSRHPARTTISKPTAEIKIEIDLNSARVADTIYLSLLPETKQPIGFRSQVTVQKRGRIITLRIAAQDIVALRAAANTLMRFVSIALKTLNAVAPFYRAISPD